MASSDKLTIPLFHQMFLEAYPDLGSLVEAFPDSPHRKMSALRKRMDEILSQGDAEEYLHCLKFVEAMHQFKEWDFYVENAFDVNFTDVYKSYDPRALALAGKVDHPQAFDGSLLPFRNLPPETRTETIQPMHPDMAYWTIDRAIEQSIRYVRQTTEPGRFAVMNWLIEPTPQQPAINFINELGRTVADLSKRQSIMEVASDGMIEGIQQFQQEMLNEQQRNIGGFRITVLEALWHPVDSSARIYCMVTGLLFKKVLEQVQWVKVHE